MLPFTGGSALVGLWRFWLTCVHAWSVLCLLYVALLEGGCATVFALSPDRVEGGLYESPDSPKSFPRVYSGTIGDGYCLTHDRSGQIGFWCLLDLPLSLAADTVVLPFTAYQQVRHGNYHARCIPEQREQTCKVRKQAVESAIESCRNQHEPRSKTCRSMIADDATVLEPLGTCEPCPLAQRTE